MCEAWPGPRCNDKCQTRDIKQKAFHEVAQKHDKATIEYNNALIELVVAQKVYDTTPKGIQELKEMVEASSGSDNHHSYASRLLQGQTTRIMQTEALKEIQNGRLHAISRLTHLLQNEYSTDEIEFIIASARENKENRKLNEIHNGLLKNEVYTIDDINQTIEQANVKAGEEYYDYVDKITTAIQSLVSSKHSEQINNDLQLLQKLEPPSEVNLQAYRSIGNAINKAKEQTRDEIMRISAIQDAPAHIVAEYFDAYREQYKNIYSKLPSSEQPNPPKEWVEASIPQCGITKSNETRFIPRDPATIYAIYKLRTDLNAIPDYLKQATKISSIDKTDETIIITHTSRTGKLLNKEQHPIRQLPSILARDVKDSIIIIDSIDEATLNNIKDLSKLIMLKDLAKKHFNTTSATLDELSKEFKTNTSSLSVYSAMRKKILKTWSTKQARTSTPVLDFKPTGKTRSTQLVR